MQMTTAPCFFCQETMDRWLRHLKPLWIPCGDNFKKVYGEERVQEAHASENSGLESEYHWRTQVPGIWEPKIPPTKRPSTAWHTILAMRAIAIAGRIGLQGMQPRLSICTHRRTAGAHLVKYHRSLQFYLPRHSHLGTHIQIRVRGRESPQSRQRTHQWSLSHQTRQHH